MNYREIERGGCQTSFDFGGQFWHCFTSGKNTDILFVCDEHFVFAMNVVAQGAFLFKDRVGIIAFELMNNHFHYILSGAETDILEFFNFIKKRISREIPKAAKLQLQYKPAADLQTLRNNIVYVNRNGYVANPNYTPFSYPWGTGRYYFNISPHEGDIEDLTVTKLREMMHGRALPFPKDWCYLDGYITPDSYCRLQFGMSLFRDAHHYFSMVSSSLIRNCFPRSSRFSVQDMMEPDLPVCLLPRNLTLPEFSITIIARPMARSAVSLGFLSLRLTVCFL